MLALADSNANDDESTTSTLTLIVEGDDAEPSDDTSANDTAAKDTAGEDTAGEDTAADDTTAEETDSGERPAKQKAKPDSAADEVDTNENDADEIDTDEMDTNEIDAKDLEAAENQSESLNSAGEAGSPAETDDQDSISDQSAKNHASSSPENVAQDGPTLASPQDDSGAQRSKGNAKLHRGKNRAPLPQLNPTPARKPANRANQEVLKGLPAKKKPSQVAGSEDIEESEDQEERSIRVPGLGDPPHPPEAGEEQAANDLVDSPAEAASPSLLDIDPSEPLSGEMLQRRDRLRRVLNYYYRQREPNTRDHNPWEVMHWIIGYGVDAEVRRIGRGGSQVNAITWLCVGGRCKDDVLFEVKNGHLTARKGVNVQGHYGQLLAIFAQAHLPRDYPIRVNGRHFTVDDLVKEEMIDCKENMELTFKLISLAHYLDLDETWTNKAGQSWSITKLMHEEMAAPIKGAACGGTHRLMGLSYALRKRKLRGEPIDGEYRRAEKYISDFHRYTFTLQNKDGSFSTNWLVSREARPDIDRRIQTTGHIVEWLAFSLPKEKLQSPQFLRAIDYLITALTRQRNHEWSIGPLGHTLHALALYDQRMYGAEDGNRFPLALKENLPVVPLDRSTSKQDGSASNGRPQGSPRRYGRVGMR